jgi:prephenate dehydrogenase
VPHTCTDAPALGLIGFGAFGRLAARHLRRHFRVLAYDPAAAEDEAGVAFVGLAEAASCPVVVLAVPVCRLAETVAAVAPHLRAGALVLDVGSVKEEPARLMREGLPDDVEIIATHPLFGPQSARDGIAGLKIAICPVRGRSGRRVAAFLRRAFGLDVIVTTPENHDRDAALAQGLTHLIAGLVVRMEPLPSRITTRSFDLLMEAVGMVRHDAPEVFEAIVRANPYAAEMRRRFAALAGAIDG